ncbi:trimeric intracellular cation channel family protein [Serinicoccus kebangsaanensis]|uniref:trimeric intracellular cation channel family protein n=1 Tax=Serinicoccus kebangsaanensis TaxID=2602069 RepID=UPI00124F65E3|nr:trimeric intracellular cation channel family protein [Serinicoccus kebangsaanensis]
MIAASADVRLALDLVGIFVFALSGGLVAVRARLDLFGVAVLAWVSGLGGGIIRDVFLGDVPPDGISNPWYVVTVVAAGLVVFAFHGLYVDLSRHRPKLRLDRISASVKYLDAVGLATFAVAGALKAVALDAPPLAAVFVGGITAVGGGVIRDVLVGQVPEVLRRELYAVPALLGATAVVVAAEVGQLSFLVIWSTLALVLGIRIAAIVFDLHAPTPSPSRGDAA